jgi:hypothetical protein
VKKKPLLAVAFISVLLFSGIVEIQVANVVLAQFNPLRNDPDPNPPSISVQSPKHNQIYNSTDIWLNFTVAKPETWFVYNVAYGCQGEIKFVRYTLDGQESANISANDIAWGDYKSPLGRTLEFSINLTELPEGLHNLMLIAEGTYYYYNRTLQQVLTNTVVGNSSEIGFTVDTVPPEITILSVKNETYYTTEMPLNFKLDEAASSMAYSLNGEAAVTISGNVTLPELSYGSHNLTLYATDMAGNTATSKTVYFSVESSKPFPATLVIAPIAAVAVVGVSLLVYFKKRRH